MHAAIGRGARDSPASRSNQVRTDQTTPVDTLVATREVDSNSATDSLNASNRLIAEASLLASAVAGIVDEGAVDGCLEIIAVDAVAGAGVINGDSDTLAVVAGFAPATRFESPRERWESGTEAVEKEESGEDEKNGTAEVCHCDSVV